MRFEWATALVAESIFEITKIRVFRVLPCFRGCACARGCFFDWLVSGLGSPVVGGVSLCIKILWKRMVTSSVAIEELPVRWRHTNSMHECKTNNLNGNASCEPVREELTIGRQSTCACKNCWESISIVLPRVTRFFSERAREILFGDSENYEHIVGNFKSQLKRKYK